MVALVVNTDTGEVLKYIPMKEILETLNEAVILLIDQNE